MSATVASASRTRRYWVPSAVAVAISAPWPTTFPATVMVPRPSAMSIWPASRLPAIVAARSPRPSVISTGAVVLPVAFPVVLVVTALSSATVRSETLSPASRVMLPPPSVPMPLPKYFGAMAISVSWPTVPIRHSCVVSPMALPLNVLMLVLL